MEVFGTGLDLDADAKLKDLGGKQNVRLFKADRAKFHSTVAKAGLEGIITLLARCQFYIDGHYHRDIFTKDSSSSDVN